MQQPKQTRLSLKSGCLPLPACSDWWQVLWRQFIVLSSNVAHFCWPAGIFLRSSQKLLSCTSSDISRKLELFEIPCAVLLILHFLRGLLAELAYLALVRRSCYFGGLLILLLPLALLDICCGMPCEDV
jgi:hypothetical protein